MPKAPKRPSRYSKGVARGRAYRAAGKYPLRHYYGPTANQSAAVIQAAVKRAINKNIETKTACFSASDGTEIGHNNFITLSPTILFTTPGPNDPTLNSSDCRIGDEINLKGVSMKMMVELNERYSDVTFRLMVVKCAKSDTPTRATLFNGLSGNKMIDTFNSERYTLLYQKYFKITAKQEGTDASLIGSSGLYDKSDLTITQSRATRIIKVWIPGHKFVKSGVVKYEQGSSQPKFYDYHAVLYAYSNYSTNQDIWNVGRLNEYIHQIYYKDA